MQLILSVLFALPLLANIVAIRLGYVVFLLADPVVQSIWGLLTLFTAIWGILTIRRHAGVSVRLGALAAVLGCALCGYCVLQTFRPGAPEVPGEPQLSYIVSAGLIVLLPLGKLWEHRRQGPR